MVIATNRYLTKEEMKINAEWILTYLLGKGWTKNAVCGMLGNMETESTINPGIWQNLDYGNASLGFGLVQWTPSTKYTNWATANGYDINDITGQMLRLEYEIGNNIQWIATDEYSLSFQEFKVSSQTPEYLAQAFLKNYERPGDQNQPIRSTQARYWFDILSGEGGSTDCWNGTITDFYLGLDNSHSLTSSYGWRIHPITFEETFHTGDDVAKSGDPSPETPVPSAVEIITVGSGSTGLGNYVVYHILDTNYIVLIGHLATIKVSVGDIISTGTSIGIMGATGDVTGRHWHIEVRDFTEGSFFSSRHYDPKVLQFNVCGTTTPGRSSTSDLIHLYLSGAVNNWLNA